MTSSAKTLRALEGAAMRWYRSLVKLGWREANLYGHAQTLFRACAAHAAALKRKRTGKGKG